jgi:surfeit locus 1 family protein
MSVLRAGRWCFELSLWPTLGTVILLPVLTGLGFWQLDRAGQKQHLQQQYDAGLSAPPLTLTTALVDIASVKYRRVVVRGVYAPAQEILLDNRIYQGQAGYHVFTPLHIAGGDRRVLVNRGWVAAGRDRQVRPETPAPAGEQQIHGVAVLPSGPGLKLGPAYPEGPDWPGVWQHLELDSYARRAGVPLQPVVILLDPESPAGGFARQWARLDAGIATHQGYALTWFSLAVVLAAIYILLNLKRCE